MQQELSRFWPVLRLQGCRGFIGTYPPGAYPPTMGPLWLAGQSGYNQNNISANYQTLTYNGPTWSYYQVEVPMSDWQKHGIEFFGPNELHVGLRRFDLDQQSSSSGRMNCTLA